MNEKIRDHDIKLSTPNVLSRDGYGWTEFISFKACNCLKDVQNFYQRTGAQIGLLYALKAVDFHSENLIANGAIQFSLIWNPYFILHTRKRMGWTLMKS